MTQLPLRRVGRRAGQAPVCRQPTAPWSASIIAASPPLDSGPPLCSGRRRSSHAERQVRGIEDQWNLERAVEAARSAEGTGPCSTWNTNRNGTREPAGHRGSTHLAAALSPAHVPRGTRAAQAPVASAVPTEARPAATCTPASVPRGTRAHGRQQRGTMRPAPTTSPADVPRGTEHHPSRKPGWCSTWNTHQEAATPADPGRRPSSPGGRQAPQPRNPKAEGRDRTRG